MMYRTLLSLCLAMLLMPVQGQTDSMKKYAIVIHGGAGTILKKNMSPEKEAAYRAKLEEALMAGQAILDTGGHAADAVEAAIHVMENSPLFNAGKGAVFTNSETNELDASIMDGATRNAGAVSGITKAKNPISAARAVMEKSDHVMLSGEGANAFAEAQGLEMVDTSYFRDEIRLKQLRKVKHREQTILDHDGDQGEALPDSSEVEFHYDSDIDLNKDLGTVGAVALDMDGNIVAGTSTGGMTNKRYGRIGDSPIIGSGTYANNATCGVSATGHGEFFMRWVVAYDIHALMEYKGMTLEEAANEVIHNKLEAVDGRGGVIALDSDGNIVMPFNTAGMYRACYTVDGEVKIAIYKSED